jgi:hypothetical protein
LKPLFRAFIEKRYQAARREMRFLDLIQLVRKIMKSVELRRPPVFRKTPPGKKCQNGRGYLYRPSMPWNKTPHYGLG